MVVTGIGVVVNLAVANDFVGAFFQVNGMRAGTRKLNHRQVILLTIERYGFEEPHCIGQHVAPCEATAAALFKIEVFARLHMLEHRKPIIAITFGINNDFITGLKFVERVLTIFAELRRIRQSAKRPVEPLALQMERRWFVVKEH